MRRVSAVIFVAVSAVAVAADLRLVKITEATRSMEAARPRFSPDGEWLYFDDQDESGKYRIYRQRVNGSGRECLTCDQAELTGHTGSGNFHPSGRYIVFSAEKKEHAYVPEKRRVNTPGAGIFNDVAILDLKTRRVFRLTDVRPGKRRQPPGGSLFPRLSPDGRKIAWGDFVRAGDSRKRFGEFRLAVAEFIPTPEPHLGRIDYFDPGEALGLVEVQGWSLDSRYVYYACVPLKEQDGNAADICQTDVTTGRWKRITPTSGLRGERAEFEEHAALRPQGDILAYMSSEPHGVDFKKFFLLWLATDLWFANPDGSNRRQITYFNVEGHREYTGSRVMVSEMGWSPDGTKLAARVYYVNKLLNRNDDVSSIKIFHFE
jgi:Tol biopolymer transport system component